MIGIILLLFLPFFEGKEMKLRKSKQRAQT